MSSKKGSRTNSDAANTFIRSLLSKISRYFGEWGKSEQQKTRDFFKDKCPYTGRKLGKNKSLDHIIPQNKEQCGLHVYGNLVWTNKKTNGKKSSKDYRTFIKEDKKASSKKKDERIKQIEEFMEISGYTKTRDEYSEKIKKFAQKKYDEIVNMITESEKELAKELGVTSDGKFWKWTRLKESTKNYYRAALNRILKDADKNFEEFTSDIKTINKYLSDSNKVSVGGRYGRTVLNKLLEYKKSLSQEEKKECAHSIVHKNKKTSPQKSTK